MRIDLVFDTICPWCFIGKRQLDLPWRRLRRPRRRSTASRRREFGRELAALEPRDDDAPCTVWTMMRMSNCKSALLSIFQLTYATTPWSSREPTTRTALAPRRRQFREPAVRHPERRKTSRHRFSRFDRCTRSLRRRAAACVRRRVARRRQSCPKSSPAVRTRSNDLRPWQTFQCRTRDARRLNLARHRSPCRAPGASRRP